MYGYIYVLLGYGNGTFGQRTRFSVENCLVLTGISVADFNSDNYLDIAVTRVITNANRTFTQKVILDTGRDSQTVLGQFVADSSSHGQFVAMMGQWKISTRKLEYERADVTLELERTLLTSPSHPHILTRTLICTLVLKFPRAYLSGSRNDMTELYHCDELSGDELSCNELSIRRIVHNELSGHPIPTILKCETRQWLDKYQYS